MKIFDEDMQGTTAGNFQFSGVRPEKLGAVEYTLVTMVTDKSGSVNGFENEILKVKKTVVAACRKSPRAEFLMMRNVEFNSDIEEIHGFKELSTIDENAYQPPDCHGGTALYDATFSAIAATNEYAKTLSDAEFSVNAIVFVETDGENTRSVQTPASIAAEIQRGVQNEWLESILVILIGVNAARYKAELTKFQQDAGLHQYVDAGSATPATLAKVADFVSKSVSSQSQSLGTGGPSQPLKF